MSTDELGSLAEGFNAMAARLETAHTELWTKNQDLERALRKIELLERAKQELTKFVPSAVRRLVEDGPGPLSVDEGGASDVSVLFLDIAGYTRMSEALDPHIVNYLVERYFSVYLDDIYRNGGDINETAGDGLMIIFRGANPQEHARAAVRTAIAIESKTAAINQSLRGNEHPVRVHIGINSGPATVGIRRFQGVSGERWTYTASGSTTNVAARITAMAGAGELLLGEETATRVTDLVVLESLGEFTLKNLSAPVRVYRVAVPGESTTSSPDSGLAPGGAFDVPLKGGLLP